MPEDRDQLFLKALARHLRTGSAASSLCLDPETLAAYHERTLTPAELASLKSHIVSCARCQEILAQLEATEEINELEETSEVVPAIALAAAPVASELRRQTASQDTAAQASPEKVVAIPRKRFASLRWAAPAGAIAAALLVWISVRHAGILLKPPSDGAPISADRRPAPALSAAEEAKAPGPPQEKEAQRQKSDDSSAARRNETAPAPPPAPQPSLLDEDRESAAAGRIEQKEQKLSARDAYAYSTRTKGGQAGGRGPSAPSPQNQANDALLRSDQNVLGGDAQMAERAADHDKAELRKAAPPAKSGMIAGAAKAVPPPAPLAPKRLPGRLRGTVTDPSGAAVAGANVQLQDDGGRTIASTSTDTAGTYLFSGVAEGNYQLQLESPGFRTDILSGLNVQAGENVMNARLELGAASETVQVTAPAAAPAIASSSSQVVELRALPRDVPDLKSKDSLELLIGSRGFGSVASPDGQAVWKFGEAGQIFHSVNGGKEWSSQDSGVTVKLLSASAPSAKVCWVAGASGTVLRTTDGGKHWMKVTVPIHGDLGGVHASDAKHASISDPPNRVRYETTDGGKTWIQITNP
jgi:hypothetical protein